MENNKNKGNMYEREKKISLYYIVLYAYLSIHMREYILFLLKIINNFNFRVQFIVAKIF